MGQHIIMHCKRRFFSFLFLWDKNRGGSDGSDGDGGGGEIKRWMGTTVSNLIIIYFLQHGFQQSVRRDCLNCLTVFFSSYLFLEMCMYP